MSSFLYGSSSSSSSSDDESGDGNHDHIMSSAGMLSGGHDDDDPNRNHHQQQELTATTSALAQNEANNDEEDVEDDDEEEEMEEEEEVEDDHHHAINDDPYAVPSVMTSPAAAAVAVKEENDAVMVAVTMAAIAAAADMPSNGNSTTPPSQSAAMSFKGEDDDDDDDDSEMRGNGRLRSILGGGSHYNTNTSSSPHFMLNKAAPAIPLRNFIHHRSGYLQENESSQGTKTTAKSSSSSSSVFSWRVNDPIYSILYSRQQILKSLGLPLSSSSSLSLESSKTTSTKNTTKHKKSTIQNYHYSNKFKVTEIIQQIQGSITKQEQGQRAFEAAALSVLRALYRQKEEDRRIASNALSPFGSQSRNTNDDIDNGMSQMVQVFDSLESRKDECFDTIASKSNVQSLSSSTKATKSSVSGSTGSKKRSRKEDGSDNATNSKKKKKTTGTSTESVLNSGSGGTGTTTSSTTISEPPSSSSSSAAAPTVSLAGTLSSTNIDSRATVSRAILCAAASYTFKHLTPSLSLGDNGGDDLNVLDVPQNTHRKQQGNNNNDDDGDEKVEEENNDTNNLSSEQSQSKKDDKQQPSINMGAVMMSAEIFAKRSMEQARGSALRSERRRRWRMECAKSELALLSSSGNSNMKCTPCSDGGSMLDIWWNGQNAYADSKFDSFTKKADGDVSIVTENSDDDDDDDDPDDFNNMNIEISRKRISARKKTNSWEWMDQCLPRLMKIMLSGPGHVVLHDIQWRSRADRVIQVLEKLAAEPDNEEEIYDMSETSAENQNLTGDGVISNDEPDIINQRMPNYGPHLIVTTKTDMQNFLDLLAPVDYSSARLNGVTTVNEDGDDEFCGDGKGTSFRLRALRYCGTNAKRRNLRMEHFTSASLSGLPDCPFNTIVTSYETFIKDYVHLCQIPFQAVVLDDGMSWLGTAHYDPNGQLGKVFDMGIWSKSDNHAGLAGVGFDKWDFSLQVQSDGSLIDPTSTTSISKDMFESCKRMKPLIGLSARHKIVVASSLHSVYRDTYYPAPVPGLLSFLIPQFADVVKEEWDRSRIHTCSQSMEHVRKLLCRGICVFTGSNEPQEISSLIMSSMLGTLDVKKFHDILHADKVNGSDSDSDLNDDAPLAAFRSSRASHILPSIPHEYTTDELINDGKIVQSRRFAASWLRSLSPIRYELGSASLGYIVNVMKAKAASGHVCEEVVTASSITSSGAGGVVTGPAGYKTAVRCGRTFGSEQGLRQHIAALHAPPGTWLCRSCGIDCGTSQARTHHERSCGTNATAITPGGIKENSSGGGIPTVGQGIGSATSSKQVTGNNTQSPDDKDEKGCFRVPGYRGVWVNPMGKHFVKIDGKPLVQNEEGKEKDSILLCKNAEEAARMHDDTIRQRGKHKSAEMNFKEDGSRIVYEDSTTNTAAGRGLEMLGGGASSVVPALSVINIKDLPKGVVPLLRDPKQTSRTGGNSKRYIYAYRGVCRQARKGHDRWQSQISFGGTNHYLGTFDSEWDAAAIYAWAHLILYGEEATKKAQKEGEEAVAAYEQEKKDIAEGKIVAPPPKPKKKKPAKTKAANSKAKNEKKDSTQKKSTERGGNLKATTKDMVKAVIPKMNSQVFQEGWISGDDNILMQKASERMFALHEAMGKSSSPATDTHVCIPVEQSTSDLPTGFAMLIGLSSTDCDWDIDSFVDSTEDVIDDAANTFLPVLTSEYGSNGLNVRFRTVLRGTSCFIGKAGKDLEQASTAFGLMGAKMGGTIANIDCNIGGIDGSCSEVAACISFVPGKTQSFYFSACNDEDIVTLNGERLAHSMGKFPLENEDICGVGSRVFVFVVPQC